MIESQYLAHVLNAFHHSRPEMAPRSTLVIPTLFMLTPKQDMIAEILLI